MARWYYCNVLRSSKDSRDLWQYVTANRKYRLHKQESTLAAETLSSRLYAKDWENVVQPRLNVAWFPPDNVYIRVVQLPKADPEETAAMLDLQMEKLSPIPVGQAVWAYEIIPQASEEMQTAVLVIVARHLVDAFLDTLESIQFYSDRLELPFLDQLKSSTVQKDGVWMFAGWGGDPNTAMVAWRAKGVLQHLSLIHLPAEGNRVEIFQKQLRQMSWTGELEGWLEQDLPFYMVADPETATLWQQIFDLEQQVDVVPPPTQAELSLQTTQRVCNDSQHTNLLPEEKLREYKDHFVTRLWMRGIGATIALYMIGVAVYFGWVEIAKWKLDKLAIQANGLALTYTNTLQLKEQIKVMQNQMALQFAALDCWKAAADNLPVELTLDQFNFERGRRVTYYGTVAMDDVQKVNDFYDAIRNATVEDRRLFASVDPPKINPRPPRDMAWSFVCELERSENE